MSFRAGSPIGGGMTEYIGTLLDPEELIRNLRIRPNLKSLSLSTRNSGDEGFKVLFKWLAYGDDDGVYKENNDKDDCLSLPLPQLVNVSIPGVCLGNMGFGALVEWLERLKERQQMNMRISPSTPSKVPEGIRELSLEHNRIEGTSELALLFVSALTFRKIESPYISSSLSYLNLSSNPLSSEFKQALFSSLASLQSLRMLFLSMTGLNQTDASALAAYIGQCRLTDFNASANKMGYRGLKQILKAMKRCWTLERVDIYANDVEDSGDNDEYESSDDEGESPRNRGIVFIDISGSKWRILDQNLQRILSRNSYLKPIVRHQAFELLRYSRLFLLNGDSDDGRPHSELDLLEELVAQEAPHHSGCIHHNCECMPTFYQSHSRTPSPVPIDPLQSHFSFTRLPIEIQLTILSQLAPILSPSQQIRIFEHAIDKTTLPDISLRLPSFSGGGGMLRTASSSTSTQPAFASGGTGSLTRTGNSTRTTVSTGAKYPARIGSFEAGLTEKQRWLELVGCDAYDPNW